MQQHAQQLQPAHAAAGAWPPSPQPPAASLAAGPAAPVSRNDRACKRKASQSQAAEEEHGAKLLRQQLQNKAAQQRYRQRRRDREAGLEQSLGQRTAQLEQAARHAAALDARVKELEGALLAARQQGWGQPGAQRAPANSKAACGGGARGGAAADARSSYCASLTSIQAFVREHGLRDRLRAGLPLPGPLLAAVTERVRACADACAAAIDVSRPGALDLLVSSAGGGGCCADSAACCASPSPGGERGGRAATERLWLQVISDLALSDAQIDGLLALRLDLLRELNALYARRSAAAERLAVEAAAGGASHRGSSIAAAAAGGRVPLTVQADRMRQGGYLLDVAPGSLAVREIVQAMQADLQEEGRLLSGFTLRVMTEVLAPLQAAVMATTAFPHATDVLSLANALSELTHTAPSLAALLPAHCPPVTATGAAVAPRPTRAALVAAAAAAAAEALTSGGAPASTGWPERAAGATAGPFLMAAPVVPALLLAPAVLAAPPASCWGVAPSSATPCSFRPAAAGAFYAGCAQLQASGCSASGCSTPDTRSGGTPASCCGAGGASGLGAPESACSGDDGTTSCAQLPGSAGDLHAFLEGLLESEEEGEAGTRAAGAWARPVQAAAAAGFSVPAGPAAPAGADCAARCSGAGAAEVAAGGTLSLDGCVPLDEGDFSTLVKELAWL